MASPALIPMALLIQNVFGPFTRNDFMSEERGTCSREIFLPVGVTTDISRRSSLGNCITLDSALVAYFSTNSLSRLILSSGGIILDSKGKHAALARFSFSAFDLVYFCLINPL